MNTPTNIPSTALQLYTGPRRTAIPDDPSESAAKRVLLECERPGPTFASMMDAIKHMGTLRAVYRSLFGTLDEMKAALRPYVPTNCEIEGIADVCTVHDTVCVTVNLRPIRTPEIIVVDYVVDALGCQLNKAKDAH